LRSQHEWTIENTRTLVESSLALRSATQANDFLVFDGEFVVVGDLLPARDWLLRINHNFLAVLQVDDFRIAVRLENWRREVELLIIDDIKLLPVIDKCYYCPVIIGNN
jgi:hypothetical protein